MSSSDLPFGSKLSDQAGWNQTAADWRRFLELQPGGCFVAEIGGQLVGTVATCVFDQVGWIGMMLVASSARRQGVGRALMNRAIVYLESQAIDAIRLDATPMGEPLYTSLGFKTQYRLTRFAGTVSCRSDKRDFTYFQKPEPDWEQIAVFDKAQTGYSRQKLFSKFGKEPDIHVFVDYDDRQMLGYVCARPGRLATHVGPCMAHSSEVGERLLRQVFRQYRSQMVFVDVPNNNRCAVETIVSVGLNPTRELVRMCRGDGTWESVESLWASSGPEKG